MGSCASNANNAGDKKPARRGHRLQAGQSHSSAEFSFDALPASMDVKQKKPVSPLSPQSRKRCISFNEKMAVTVSPRTALTARERTGVIGAPISVDDPSVLLEAPASVVPTPRADTQNIVGASATERLSVPAHRGAAGATVLGSVETVSRRRYRQRKKIEKKEVRKENVDTERDRVESHWCSVCVFRIWRRSKPSEKVDVTPKQSGCHTFYFPSYSSKYCVSYVSNPQILCSKYFFVFLWGYPDLLGRHVLHVIFLFLSLLRRFVQTRNTTRRQTGK